MMLECKELTKWFGSREAVADLTLNLDKGKIYGLLGENGSGKTTWMKMVAGLTKPGRGEIIYQGHPLDYTDKGKIAYMATEPFFYDFMTIRDVGEYYEAFFKDFDRKKYEDLLGKMGLSQELKVRNLSSGMSAKIKLAATLSRNAELYLLDEPLNGIDYKDLRTTGIQKRSGCSAMGGERSLETICTAREPAILPTESSTCILKIRSISQRTS